MSTDLLRNSERSAMKRCPQRWQWAFEDGLAPVRENTKLWFGTGVHLALAEWYQLGLKRGPHPVETWNEFCKVSSEEERSSAVYEDEELQWYNAEQMGIHVLNSYVDHYGRDRDWKVIATERTFKLAIKNSELGLKGNRVLARLVGTFDGVYRDLKTGEIWLMEHKTAAALSTKHLPLDPQAGTYHYAATRVLRKMGLIGPKEEIVGVMYNFLLKYMPPDDDRPQDDEGNFHNKPKKVHFVEAAEKHNLVLPKLTIVEYEDWFAKKGITVLGDISARQPKPIAQMFQREPVYKSIEERRNMARNIVKDARIREAYRSGELPIVKNPTRDCSWDCEFYQMCQLHEQGADWEEFRDVAMKKRDPYEGYERKSA
jgi:hypothetical protein